MPNTKAKAAVAAAATLAVVGVAGAAYAASLTLSSNSLGAGTTTVAPCADTTAAGAGIQATWTPGAAGFEDTATGFNVKQVNVTNIPAACAGKTVYVSVHDGASVIGTGSLTIPAAVAPATSTTATVPLAGLGTPVVPIKAQLVKGLNILVPN